MVRLVDAIFSQGTLRPLQPLALPEGARVRLSVEEGTHEGTLSPGGKIRTPRLARREDAADFVMEVREAGDAEV
jgi:predicted DNA-binding antitoxin AbrB/MazE fold protein